MCRKSKRHYERPTLQWPPPTSSELAAAQTLEEQMREQLSSIASFNETERMVLLKQFDVQARWAKSQAQRLHNPNACPPSGLLSVDQFIAAWHNLSVKVCSAECLCQGKLLSMFSHCPILCTARQYLAHPDAYGCSSDTLCFVLQVSRRQVPSSNWSACLLGICSVGKHRFFWRRLRRSFSSLAVTLKVFYPTMCLLSGCCRVPHACWLWNLR